MTDGWYLFFLMNYILQIACIMVYSAAFIKTTVKYMLFCFANNTYRQWKFSLTVGSVALTVGVIGILYFTQVREDNSLVMQMWLPVALMFFQTKAITLRWMENMKSVR